MPFTEFGNRFSLQDRGSFQYARRNGSGSYEQPLS